MDRGLDFLKSQVNNAVMQHETLLKALEDHQMLTVLIIAGLSISISWNNP